MNIIKNTTPVRYTEISQYSSIRFAPCVKDKLASIVDPTYIELYPSVSCRDKLMNYPLFKKKKVGHYEVFGWSFGYHNPEQLKLLDLIDRKVDYFSIYFKSKEESDHLNSRFHLLNDFESTYSVPRSKLRRVNDPNNPELRYLLELSSYWTSSPLALSIVTFLIRTLSYRKFYYTDAPSFDTNASNIYQYLFNIKETEDPDDILDDEVYLFDTLLDPFDGSMSTYRYSDKTPLHFIMCNMKKILGTSPVTGVDDNAILSKMIAGQAIPESFYIERKNGNRHTFYTIRIHHSSGFYYFSKLLRGFYRNYSSDGIMSDFVDSISGSLDHWIYNSLKLIKEDINLDMKNEFMSKFKSYHSR